MPFNRFLWWVCAAQILCCSSCNYLRNVRALTKGSIAFENSTETLPFSFRKDLIVVQAHVNSDSTVREFIFDTGAFNSKIEHSLANELELEVVAEKQNSTAQGVTRKIEVVRIDSLKLGKSWVYSAGAGKLQYDPGSASVCVAENGIIGANIIKLAHWKIEYSKQLLHFSDTPFVPSQNSGSVRFERPVLSGTPKINLKINDREVQNILLDVGYNGALVLPMRLAAAFPNVETDTIFDNATSGIYGTNTDTLLVKQLKVEVAGFSAMIPVEFSSLNKALLGNGFLKHFDIILNYKNNEIFFDKTADIHVESGSNFLISPQGDSLWVVSRTSTKLPFKLGDTFVSVNAKKPNEVYTDFCDFVMNRKTFFSKKPLILETMDGTFITWDGTE